MYSDIDAFDDGEHECHTCGDPCNCYSYPCVGCSLCNEDYVVGHDYGDEDDEDDDIEWDDEEI